MAAGEVVESRSNTRNLRFSYSSCTYQKLTWTDKNQTTIVYTVATIGTTIWIGVKWLSIGRPTPKKDHYKGYSVVYQVMEEKS